MLFRSYFKANETNYLMTCPVSSGGLFFYKLAETFLYSSWAVFFLCLPVCFAYGIKQGVSLWFYPLLMGLFVPFVAIASLMGSLIAFGLILYLMKYRKVLFWLVFASGIGGLVYLGVSVARLRQETSLFTASWFLGLLDYLDFARQPLFPSTWMSKAMLSLSHQDYKEFVFYASVLISNMFLLAALGFLLAQSRYRQAWSMIHTTTSEKKFWRFSWISRTVRLLFFLSDRSRLFLEKDIKIFVRDALQWSQFGILIGLLLIYILNLRTLRYDQQNDFWKHLVAILNLTATSLTMCTFASRFIFPQLSLEGKRFWMLGVMPIKRNGVLLAKFAFAVITLLFTSEILIFLSCYMLRLPWGLTSLHVATIFGVTLGVAGISVGLGAIYPNFHEDSPSKIVSGFGGTLTLVLSLFFVLVMVAIQYVPSHFLLRERLTADVFYSWLFFSLLFTCISCILPLYIGIRNFNTIEM